MRNTTKSKRASSSRSKGRGSAKKKFYFGRVKVVSIQPAYVYGMLL